jgi:hypothetical protein
MGIRFACQACGHVLNVKQHLAGKRGLCPKCRAAIDIPEQSTASRPREPVAQQEQPALQSVAATSSGEAAIREVEARPTPAFAGASPIAPATAASPTGTSTSVTREPAVVVKAADNSVRPAPGGAVPAAVAVAPAVATAIQKVDPIAEAPQMQWCVLPPGASNHYGPAPGEMFRCWIQEGRVSPDSLVWRQDWHNWERAGDVLSQFNALSAPAIPPPGARATSPTGATVVAVPPATSPQAWSDSPVKSESPAVSAKVRRLRKSRVSTNIVIAALVLVILGLLPMVWYVIRTNS